MTKAAQGTGVEAPSVNKWMTFPTLTGGSTAIRAYDGAGEETLALRVLLSGMMSKEEEKADKGEDHEIKDDAHGEW
jgi:hypothetical protein